MNELERYAAENTGRLILKWKHYFEIYDRHFARYRNSNVHVLEIGINQGGSLQMWREYFGNQATIYGVDVDPRCLTLEEEGVKVFIGDQADPVFLEELASRIPRIDVLIDDGGHTMEQQRTTFEVLFPHVDPNGVYLVEDMHTSYWGEFGGGYRKRSSFVEFTKGLVDSLNAWHSRSRRLPVSEFTRSAHGMHFYDSVLVVEKRPISPPVEVQSGAPVFEEQAEHGPLVRAVRHLSERSRGRRLLQRLNYHLKRRRS